MKKTTIYLGVTFLFLATVAGALAMTPDHQTGDALSILKRAITQANAPALTTQQETDITALITAYKSSLPTEADEALEAAKDAYDAAILAGDQAAADTQAGIITTRQAALSLARLKASSKLQIAVLANLKTGGQLTLLVEKFSNDRVLSIVESLAGGGGGGRRGR